MVMKYFHGDNANIEAVIGLPHEIIDAKKDFEKSLRWLHRTWRQMWKWKMGTYLAPLITNGMKPDTSYDKKWNFKI